MMLMRLALVHDYLNQYGGAERVLKALCELFPDAPIYTFVYDKKGSNGEFDDHIIYPSFLQRIPGAVRYHRIFPLLMPMAAEMWDLSEYDVVISDSDGFGKGVITSPDSVHISYCHTPPRFLWDGWHDALHSSGIPRIFQYLAPPALTYLRMWDYNAASRVDHFVANSHFVASRIKKYYRRESRVIYPPVALNNFKGIWKKQDYYLLLMRLVPYKHPEIAVEAFNTLNLPLKVVGSGPLLPKLKAMAKKNIAFTGALPHAKVAQCYGQAKALIFPQEEDFGISAIEACASGTPVIAYKAGGAKETIKEGVNGMFFDEQTPESIIKAIKTFQKMKFDGTIIRKTAKYFDEKRFKQEIIALLKEVT